jgi:hypothetical protein
MCCLNSSAAGYKIECISHFITNCNALIINENKTLTTLDTIEHKKRKKEHNRKYLTVFQALILKDTAENLIYIVNYSFLSGYIFYLLFDLLIVRT